MRYSDFWDRRFLSGYGPAVIYGVVFGLVLVLWWR